MGSETTLAYARHTRLDADGLQMATSGGRAEHPYFFRGRIDNAEQAARALLAVAEVSRARYFDASVSDRLKDPVVTSNVSVLRFESFSSCNGVYARFDLDAGGFDAEWLDWGSTNVDLNEPVRRALAAVVPGQCLRLTVGAEEVAVETLAGKAVERKVPLPERWLRGFAETQIAAAHMRLIVSLEGASARAALRELPRLKPDPRSPWVSFSSGKPRPTSVASELTPCLVGPHRLGALASLAQYATALHVYSQPLRGRLNTEGAVTGVPVRLPTAWVIEMDRARFTLVISPELYRGFSGEGAVLTALAHVPEQHVAAVAARLAGQAGLEPADLANACGLREDEVTGALKVLGASGRTGYDLAKGVFFHRDLPYDRAVLGQFHPRLTQAWDLVGEGAVAAVGEAVYEVRSSGSLYRVSFGDEATCSCPWFLKHRGERGSCKHVLAAQLALRGTSAAGTSA